jgi:hypothetical protein
MKKRKKTFAYFAGNCPLRLAGNCRENQLAIGKAVKWKVGQNQLNEGSRL